jgi:hypothetical protein
VPQHLSDLGEPGPRAKHLRRRRVPKPVGVYLGHPGAVARSTHDRRDAAGAQALMRCPDSGEDLADGTTQPAPPEPVGDRVTDIGREREAVVPAALAPDEYLARSPVDVLKAQAGHLAGTKPEAGEQDEDGEVTPAERRSPVAAPK